MAAVTLARKIAFDAFTEVMEQGLRPEEVTERLISDSKGNVSKLDRAFIKELLFGSIRWYSKIYWILQNTSNRDLDTSPPAIRSALILGTYQIFYMDKVPDRAAVNQSVEYVKNKKLTSASSFVNGILRKIARRSEYYAKPDKKDKPVEYLSLQFAFPRWIIERWHKVFSFTQLEKMLAEINCVPPYTIRMNACKTDLDKIVDLQNELKKQEKTQSTRRPLRGCLTLKNAPSLGPESLFANGEFTIQDEAAQLIAYLVAPEENQKIVDVCSGRGGKLGHLFELSQGKADLLAIEKEEKQIDLAREAMERLGHVGISWEAEDFLDYKFAEPVDKILLDAPCSGLGILKRHPEGKWHKKPDIASKMSKLQRKMIEKALDHLKVGGELIYAVCSFEEEESLHHLDWLSEKYGDKIEKTSPVSRLPNYYKKYVTRKNMLTIYSGNLDSMDGFAAFIFKKVK